MDPSEFELASHQRPERATHATVVDLVLLVGVLLVMVVAAFVA
jgi:hypothetical protein